MAFVSVTLLNSEIADFAAASWSGPYRISPPWPHADLFGRVIYKVYRVDSPILGLADAT